MLRQEENPSPDPDTTLVDSDGEDTGKRGNGDLLMGL
jgi:hypothetical protein